MIIAIHGESKAGKDTIAKMIIEIMAKKNPPIIFEHVKFATKIKKLVAVLLDKEGEDFDNQILKNKHLGPSWNFLTPKDLMKIIGNKMGRELIDPDIWVRDLFLKFDKEKSNWVISDLRFINEYHNVIARRGKVMKVLRTTTDNKKDEIDNYLSHIKDWDYIINNDKSLHELRNNIERMLNSNPI